MVPDPNMPQGQPVMGGAPDTPPPVAGQDPNAMKMMLAHALMGGGQGGPPPSSFLGGLSQGMNPMVQQMMMQKLMGGMPQQQGPGGFMQSTVAPSVPLAPTS